MRHTRKITTALLATGLAIFAAGCGSSNTKTAAETASSAVETTTTEALTAAASTAEAEESPGTGTRIVVDHAGNEIELPEEINRIVISSILPLPSVYSLFEGSAEKLVGIHPSSMAAAENSILPRVVPDILEVNTDFLKGDELNIEELLTLKPDVVFYSANNKEEYEKLTAAGIPAIGFSTSNWDYDCVATFENWVLLLGEVLQQQDKAAGIAENGHKVYAEIQEQLDAAGELERPRVLILFHYGSGVMKTSGSNFFGQYWLESTGAVNVASELSGTADINMEQVYEWNPDIIYITNFSSSLPEDLYDNTIEGYDWSPVKAVQNKQVYKFPLGMYRWFPPASDTPLVLKWLATKNQPEIFADIDMAQEIKDYYQEFYQVELSDDDIEQIFNPAREAAGGN
ncbi:MAG: ABC transporter substrate-binding protein [Lachnospiraceae bacterium]